MNESTIAERYARAIFELGAEAGRVAQLSEEINHFAALWAENKAVRAVLNDPLLDAAKRLAITDELAGRLDIEGLGRNALLLLARRRRLSLLPDISRRLTVLVDEKLGVFRVKVTSARLLPEAYLTKLRNLVEHATGKTVKLDCAVDASLLAGILTQIGDYTIDGSVRGRLAAMEQRLLGTI